MGIRGIYKEIGAGTRVSLLKLAVESLEQRRRPLRLAIDISIWQFQVRAARGGANPAIRTLFYRLVRLLGMPVQPVFVFDGLHKPRFKRNKRSGVGDGMATAMAKRLIRLFGFNVHDAPGEAEAECALLQQKGVVDAVLSEDVDTLMFGCTRTLRNWGPGGDSDGKATAAKSKSTAPPTHVTMYDTETSLRASIAAGLDRQGMVLVALMSGGDYIPEGVPGCGIKLACEAARAGFGRTLCQFKRSDVAAVAGWRAALQHELRTNEGGTFRTLHHKLVIPETFPDLDVLRYYTHPVVSTAEAVARVREALEAAEAQTPPGPGSQPTHPIDVAGLRAFVAETFDWVNRPGAVKFIHVLAPSLLARMLLLQWTADVQGEESPEGHAMRAWPSLVEGISRQRCHPSTDGLPELRVSFVPATVVGLDLADEMDAPLEATAGTAVSFGRDGLALNSDDEYADDVDDTGPQGLPAQAQRKPNGTVAGAAAAPVDPTKPTMAWIAQAILQIGAPVALAAWDQRQQHQQQLKEQKEQRQREQQLEKQNGGAGASAGRGRGNPAARGRGRGGRGRGRGVGAMDQQAGGLDRFVQVTKATAAVQAVPAVPAVPRPSPSPSPRKTTATPRRARKEAKDVFVLSSESEGDDDEAGGSSDADLPVFSSPVASPLPKTKQPARRGAANPWTRSGAQATPRVTKAGRGSAAKTPQQKPQQRPQKKAQEDAVVIDLLSSSPFPEADETRLPEQPKEAPRTPAKAVRKQASLHSFWSPSKSSQPGPRTTKATQDLFDTDTPSSPPPITADTWPPSPPLPSFPASPRSPRSPSMRAPTEKRRTRFVPRTSAVGYFREEEGDEDDARESAVGGNAQPAGGSRSRGAKQRGWRLSEVSTVDLTGLGE